eukprot:TRINITY_DN5476_c0_g1_i3.p1 TRINITY_DN5476_c0_g1~~TRINITY_DN5476_c0_g1_i3.p1  ORF type:complete len:274 (+),score=71.09 TRINITY_DN5476_c0_g1_i3:86-823(+)
MVADELGQNSPKSLTLCCPHWWKDRLSIITAAIQRHKHIETFTMTKNNIGKDDAVFISKMIAENESLTELNLFGTKIGDAGTVVIADALKANSRLKKLFLNNSEIGDEGFIAIGEALKGHRSLRRLCLQRCWKKMGDAAVLVEGIKENQVLETLKMDVGELGKEAKEELEGVWDEETGKVKREWSQERHWSYPMRFRDQVMEVMLMWNHDQYEDGECEGIRWNEVPLEVVMNVIRWLGLFERVLE